MKKSYNKNINLEDLIKEAEKMAGFKTDVNASDLMDDANKIFSFVDKFENLDYEKIYSLPLDDKSIYVKDFENSPHANQCSVDDSIMYCGSFVLWLLGNFDRNDYSLYANLRRHGIVLRRITDEVLK